MTTKQELSEWFDRGFEQGARHMVIVCDTFDHGDYPVYTTTDEECLERVKNPGSMQRVMEVYDLNAEKAPQFSGRAWNPPAAPVFHLRSHGDVTEEQLLQLTEQPK